MESLVIYIVILIAVILTIRYIYMIFTSDKSPICESCVYKDQCESTKKKCDNYEIDSDK